MASFSERVTKLPIPILTFDFYLHDYNKTKVEEERSGVY